MALTPIERLVDQACGATGSPDKGLDAERASRETALRAEIAADVAMDVLHHIDTLYPAMWDGVAKAARTSLRNTIKQSVVQRMTCAFDVAEAERAGRVTEQ